MPENKETEAATYSVPPVERAIKLLRYIGNGHRCRNLSTAAKELGINRTTLIRLIHTLSDNRLIEEIEPDAGYRLGPGLISLAAQAIHSRDIVQVAQTELARLVEETGLSAHLGILDGTEIVYLSRETPNTHLVSNVRAGSRLPAHASSIGRAILAELPEATVRELFDGAEMRPTTEKTPKSLAALMAQRVSDREAGFAWSDGNYERGIGSCAAVVLDQKGRPAGGINVSGPQPRFDLSDKAEAEAISAAVVRAARNVSAALGFGGSRF